MRTGQGSQTTRNARRWLTPRRSADQLATWSSDISGLDLARLGTTATADEIIEHHAVTQPLVVAATLLAHAELANRGRPPTRSSPVIRWANRRVCHGRCHLPDDAIALAATAAPRWPRPAPIEATDVGRPGGDEAGVLARLDP